MRGEGVGRIWEDRAWFGRGGAPGGFTQGAENSEFGAHTIDVKGVGGGSALRIRTAGCGGDDGDSGVVREVYSLEGGEVAYVIRE